MSKRDLSYELIGSGDHTVVYCHGLPSAKGFARVHRAALASSNVRILSYDRPGYGDSPPGITSDVMEDACGVISLLDALGIHEFAVIGVSCGGPTAAAIAASAKHRCRFLGLLAAMPPGACAGNSRAGSQLAVFRHVFNSARRGGYLARIFFMLDCLIIRRDAHKALATIESLLSDSDRKVLQEKAFRQPFIEALKGAYKQGFRAAFADACKIARSTPEFLADIACPCVYYRARFDRHVTGAMSEVYSEHMASLEFREYAESGHVSIVRDAEADLFKDLCFAFVQQRGLPATS